MFDQAVLEKVLLALIPAIFAFVPAILNWLSNRALARGRAGRVALLSNELKFLEQWAALSRTQPTAAEASAPTPSLGPDLERILSEYRAIREREAAAADRPEQVSAWRRALLLFRPLSFKGWLLHTAFYFLTIFALSMIASEAIAPPVEGAESTLIHLLIGVAVLFVAPLWLLRRSALRLRDAQTAATA